jgi:hypothetical protein
MENNVKTGSTRTAHLLGLDGISVEFCFVSQHAHCCINVARISLADEPVFIRQLLSGAEVSV